MNYYSTRDHQQIVSAAQAIACGLAVGGDYLTAFAASRNRRTVGVGSGEWRMP